MKPTIYTLIAVVLLLCSTTACSAQQTSKEAKKTTIELFIPAHHFDGSKTNWSIFSLNRKRRDRRGFSRVLSFSIGLQYSREVTKKGSLTLSLVSAAISYADRSLNSVYLRTYDLYSIGYLHKLNNEKNTFSASILGAVVHRNGRDMAIVADISQYDKSRLVYADFGLTAGFRVEQLVLSSFLLLSEARFSRFLSRYVEDIDFPEDRRQASPNMTTLKFGLGYRF